MTRGAAVLRTTVGLVPAAGLLMLGAVGAAEQAVLAAALAVVLLALALRRDVDLRAGRVALAGLPVLLAVAVGLVPLPHAVLDVVAPGIAAARPGDPSWTLSLRPDETRRALATVALVVGTAVAVAALGPDRRRASTALAWGTVAWAALAVGHHLSGTRSLLGVVPVRATDGPWLAPLVDPNHHAAVLLAGVPFVVEELGRRRRSWWAAAPLVATLAWAIVVPVVARSMGALLALGLLALVALLSSRLSLAARAAGAAAVGLVGVVGAGAVLRLAPEWWRNSGAPRLAQWTDTVGMLPSFPLAGVGAGAYRAAYAPFRTVPAFHVYDHGHSDPLEIVTELGVVGVVLLLVAGALLPRARGDTRSTTLSLIALAGAAAVDFPLHLPGIAVLAGALVALRQVGDGAGARGPVRSLGLGALLLAGVAAFLVGQAALDRDVAAIRVEQPDAARVAEVARRAPWRPEPVLADLAAAWTPAAADAAAIRFADDAATLTRLAALAARAGDRGRADGLVDRALRRDPNDPRAWRLLATFRARDGDRRGAAVAWAEAFLRWPDDAVGDADLFGQVYGLLPVGLWWLDRLDGAHASWSLRLSERLLVDGQPDVAELACEQAARLSPRLHAYNRPCAEARLALGRHDEALRYLQDWTRDRGDDFWAWFTAARLAPELPGDAARGLWQRALVEAWARSPGHPRLCALITPALERACADDPSSLQPGTCALVGVARQGRAAPGASWLAGQPSFRARAADPALWKACE